MIKRSACTLVILALCAAVLWACAPPAVPPEPLPSPPPTATATQTAEEHLPFSASYYRTDGTVEGKAYPVVTLIQSTQETKAYNDANKGAYAIPSYALLDYDDAFFKDGLLLVILLEEPSGSYRHKVTGVVQTEDRTQVLIQRIKPDGAATADMAQWHIVVVLNRKDFSCGRVEATVFE